MKLVQMAIRGAFLATSVLALGACGNHSNSAPIVYGAGTPQQARVYNSPNEIYRKQQVAARRAPVQQYAAPRRLTPANAEQVEMAPIAAVYQPQQTRLATKPATKKMRGYVEVQPGDTVYAIARRYDVSPQGVIRENRLAAPYSLTIGQALKLPNGAARLAAPANTRQVVARDRLYNVKPGDTLYSISRRSNVPVQTIVAANYLEIPYTLNVGQNLLIPQSSKRLAHSTYKATAAPRNLTDIARQASYTPPAAAPSKALFEWPVRGAVISSYGPGDLGRHNDGVNIAAPAGTPVRAAADGEIVYRGDELDGYGNLLLVKHSDGFVTAYAHTDAMLVRKGQKVHQGQVIAKVGQTGSVSSPQLHFEIRQDLKSVNPRELLGAQ